MKKGISCIIPAYNEGPRIAKVLETVKKVSLINEIIVVDDGSTDSTKSEILKFDGVSIISYKKNKGKSFAIAQGIKAAKYNLILLLDSDLVGLDKKNIVDLINCVSNGEFKLALSLRGNSLWPWKLIGIDCISGERIFSKNLVNYHELLKLKSFELEAFINNKIVEHGLPIAVVYWPNVRSPLKREKMHSFFGGLKADMIMTRQVIHASGGFVPCLKQIYHLSRLKKLVNQAP